MDLSTSYEAVIPQAVRDRYVWAETRNAAQIMAATGPAQFDDIVAVLTDFTVNVDLDIRAAGGNQSDTAARLNAGFRDRGWREGDYNVGITSTLRLLPYAPAGEVRPIEDETVLASPSYLIDNLSGRVAVDVEWHAKDGNLDRDLAAYRALYDAGIIDAAAIITMKRESMRAWAVQVLGEGSTKFKSTTTTNLEKLLPRLERGDSGGCPLLAIAVCRQTV